MTSVGKEGIARADATSVFKMSRSEFAKILTLVCGYRWIVGISSLLVAGIIFGLLIDIKWLLLSVVMAFLLFPAIVLNLYYFHGLASPTFLNVIPHSVTLGSEGLQFDVFEKKDIDGEEDENGEWKLKYKEEIPYTMIREVLLMPRSVVLKTSNNGKGFLWIPSSSFPDAEAFVSAVELLNGKISKS